MQVMKWASEISYEQAYEEVAKMPDAEVSETDGVTVYLGTHPDHGRIHIIIPSAGVGMLLFPFAIQEF
ncbi:hypothetical protein [Mesorhizobium sp.]|uniref:hypothetical protein n=1 Tax=Mesorhizobium sp. TaxID=1871066 RepID=UPI000FE75100|nr:hypothetical protein [Mesorhizobium sp.]RWB95670.1 MAG: hypothetical protein EOQ56_28385 [Mesorhizobium sp.]RWI35458.1 MAG: hypothetical protein EOR14_28565 [Mesorhizobium sp.]RWJ66373.1 MAG: hypothetical protein EOR34_28570 [Mesorhizobium sp.]